MKHLRILFLFLLVTLTPLAASSPRRCIILLDKNDFAENVGRSERFYLTSKLQAAIQEESTPILVHASLWNSFIERRAFAAQALNDKSSRLAKAHDLHLKINERIAYWHDYYRTRTDDTAHMKELIVQHINQEFYSDAKTTVTDADYQLLLNYLTPFNPDYWQVYTNDQGFFLLLPAGYCALLAHNNEKMSGFKTSLLTRVENPEQPGSLFFASRLRPARSVSEQLSDFFITDDIHNLSKSCDYHEFDDLVSETETFRWDIVLSGHGGSTHYETLSPDGTLSWYSVPIISDLPLDQFHGVLDFFNEQIDTHSLHYSGCMGGGLHALLPFQRSYTSYNYALICACLTDCAVYCAWKNNLPSSGKKFLSTADLVYNRYDSQWHLPVTGAYNWDHYFTVAGSINFNTEDIPSLLPALNGISQNMLEDGCSICVPHSQQFYHLYPATFAKISDHMVALAQSTQKPINLAYANTVLLESTVIEPTIMLTQQTRFISIKPGNANHYCKKISSTSFLDITDAFWQLCWHLYDKTFLIDELTCPADFDLLMRKYRHQTNQQKLTIKHLLIHVHKDHLMRIFLTLNENAYMITAHNPDSLQYKTTIQAIMPLDDAAHTAYEAEYSKLRQQIVGYDLEIEYDNAV